MRRTVPVLVCLAAVLSMSTPAGSQTTVPAGYNVIARQDLYTGVEYVKVAKPTVPVVAHVAHIAAGAPVDLGIVNAGDKLPHSSRDLEATSAMCGRVHCIVGVDGDFHTLGTPNGGVISDGHMLRSPNPARPQLTVTRNGHLTSDPLAWSAAVVLSGGARLPVSTVNAPPGPGGLALYTPAYGARTDASLRTELLVKASDPGALNRTSSLEIRGLRTGGGTIPADGAVLSGDGQAAQQLVDLWTAVQQNVAPNHADLRIDSLVDADASIGAEPVVLRDGKRALPWNDPNLVNYQQPHTLVGWNKAGDVYLVTVDGRQTASAGLTMAQAADFLLGLGVTDAVNLDGGGGTVFTAGGTVWNRPSDNDPADPDRYLERGAVNAFVVTARPGAPLPPDAPPAPPPLPDGGTTPGSVGAPSGPSPAAGTTFTDLPFGPGNGVGGSINAGDLPLGRAAFPGGSASQPGRLLSGGPAPEGLSEGESAAPLTSATPGSATADEGAPSKAIRSTLSTASMLLGEAVSPLTGGVPWWPPVNPGDVAVGSTALLLLALSYRRLHQNSGVTGGPRDRHGG